jgi:hypothetical protein
MTRTLKIVHWVPRILCILAMLFLLMFSFDAFDPNLTLKDQLLGFLMHSIPVFILAILLIVAWKWELVGGIIFTALGIGFSPYLFSGNYRMNHSVWMSLGIILLITFPFIVVGILFILNHYLKKKQAEG